MVQILVNIRNWYLGWPTPLKTALYLAVVALVGLAMHFGWVWPITSNEVIAYVVAAYAVLVPIFRQYVLPVLEQWFLSLFGYVPAAPALAARAKFVLPTPALWVKA